MVYLTASNKFDPLFGHNYVEPNDMHLCFPDSEIELQMPDVEIHGLEEEPPAEPIADASHSENDIPPPKKKKRRVTKSGTLGRNLSTHNGHPIINRKGTMKYRNRLPLI